MPFWNYNNNEITIKIVYYGPTLSGKTECLRFIYNRAGIKKKGKLITLDQDGVVFVSDSQVVSRELNIESLQNLQKNMEANKISFTETPIIFQYNKRDLNEILPVDILNKDLNPDYKLFFTTGAISGENIIEGLKAIIEMVIPYLIDHVKHKMILQEESYNSLTPGGKIENKFEKFLLPLSKFDINNGFNDEDEEKSNNNDSQKKNEIFDLNGEEEGEIANEQTALNKDEEIFALMETKPSSLI